METNIIEVKSKKQLATYIDFPHDLYRNDKNYVPELFIAQRDLLTPEKHPFYKHSSIQLFIAYRDGKVAGRIAAIYNVNHNTFTKGNDGFFGFFDTVNDQKVAASLLERASKWVREQGADRIIGPINLSTNDSCGLLVDGFDSPPVVMMPYNASYYQGLLENYGFEKHVDLFAYIIRKNNISERSVKLLDMLETRLKRSNIIIRMIDKKHLKEEIPKIKELYNKAWDKNLGFVPFTDEEFDYVAKDLSLLLDTDYCIIAEQEGKLVGFTLGIPDINQILINIKNGRLLPSGIFKLLFQRKKINGVRVLMLGVLEGYRKLGIEACLYGHLIKNGIRKGVEYAECSWMLEHNYLMNHAIEQINGEHYKRYRIFKKAL